MVQEAADFFTLTYKTIPSGEGVIEAKIDIYPPSNLISQPPAVDPPLLPVLVYFHGGGLTVGNRQSWVPTWLKRRLSEAGFVFICADYQLLPPATGHEILSDVQCLLAFLSTQEFQYPSPDQTFGDESAPSLPTAQIRKFKIDPDAIAVSGSSAGGLCAYLAAARCVSPKPRAVLSMYGLGGNFMTPLFLALKTKPFDRGREILDPNDFLPYLHFIHHPCSSTVANTENPLSLLHPIVDSPPKYHPLTYRIPNYPANPRMFVSRLYAQLGVFLDYYTGSFEDGGLSPCLRKALGIGSDIDDSVQSHVSDDSMRSLIPPRHLDILPQFWVGKDWPPTMILHGTLDTAVRIEESRHLAGKLKAAGVEVQVHEVEGLEHSFDYLPAAEESFGDIFDSALEFLKQHLGRRGEARRDD